MAMTIPQRRRFLLTVSVVSLLAGIASLAWAIFNTVMNDTTAVDLVFLYIQSIGPLFVGVILIGQGHHLTSLAKPGDEADDERSGAQESAPPIVHRLHDGPTTDARNDKNPG